MPEIDIIVNSDRAVNAVQNFNKSVDDMGKGLNAGSAQIAQVESGLGSMAGQFIQAQIVMAGFNEALKLGNELLFGSVGVAAEYEKATVGLNSAFEISGRNMPGMIDDLKKYAASVSGIGLADDAAITKTESVTMMMTTLNKEGIEQVTRGAIGLSNEFGIDLTRATEAAARGMEGNYRALNLMIPAVRMATTDAEKHAAMIKAFEEFYQKAIAETDTYTGTVKKLSIAWHETKEAFGEAIIEGGVLQDAMKGLTDGLNALRGGTRANKDAALEQVEAEKEALSIMIRVAVATHQTTDWLAWQMKTYHENAASILEDARAGEFGIAVQKASEEAVKRHNDQIDRQKKLFTETGPAALLTAEDIKKANAAVEKTFRDFEDIKELGVSGALDIIFPTMGEKSQMEEFWKGVDARVDETKGGFVSLANELKPFENIWHATLKKMEDNATQFGMSSGNVFRDVGKTFAKMTEDLISGEERQVLKHIELAHQGIDVDKQKSLSGLIASIFEWVPWPLDIILAAGAFAVIDSLWSKLMKFEAGGTFRQPTIAMLGEGPRTEYALDEPKLTSIVRGAMGGGAPSVGGGGSGPTMMLNFNGPIISTPQLNDFQIDQAFDKIFAAAERGARKHGISLVRKVGRA